VSTFQRGTKDIENASGLVVREDMQDTIKAVAAHNYGPLSSGGELLPTEFIAEDSGTPKKLFIRGTSGGNLAQRGVTGSATLYEVGNLDEDNLGLVKRTGDTFRGQVLFSNSTSSSTPAISFDGDTDTGIYRPGSDVMAFKTGSAVRASVGSYGIEITFGGNLELKNAAQTFFTGLTANDSIGESRTYVLPQTKVDGGFLKVASSNGGNSTLAWEAVASVPVAAVFCMATSDVPDGYLECNGESISGSGSVQGVNKNLLGDLRNKIGNSLPDLRGEFVRGWASNTNDSTRDQGRPIRGTQSSDIVSHNHTASSTATVNDPSHHHSPTTGTSNNSTADGGTLAVNDRVVGNYGSGNGQGLGPLGTRQFMNNTQCGISVGVSTTVNNTGGSETRPRNVALMYIIKY
tara:strand:+ start:1819 stop:3030 length:1212 start_codon:yes stop_codon:yes gene_type:complete